MHSYASEKMMFVPLIEFANHTDDGELVLQSDKVLSSLYGK